MSGSLGIAFPISLKVGTGGAIFLVNRRDSQRAVMLKPGQTYRRSCLLCELPSLLHDSMPPDPELVDLIEWAFLEGQIDGVKADLAYL